MVTPGSIPPTNATFSAGGELHRPLSDLAPARCGIVLGSRPAADNKLRLLGRRLDPFWPRGICKYAERSRTHWGWEPTCHTAKEKSASTDPNHHSKSEELAAEERVTSTSPWCPTSPKRRSSEPRPQLGRGNGIRRVPILRTHHRPSDLLDPGCPEQPDAASSCVNLLVGRLFKLVMRGRRLV